MAQPVLMIESATLDELQQMLSAKGFRMIKRNKLSIRLKDNVSFSQLSDEGILEWCWKNNVFYSAQSDHVFKIR